MGNIIYSNLVLLISRVELGDLSIYLKSKSDRLLGILGFLKQDIDAAIDLINANIDQIKTVWADRTDSIIKNIEENPAKYLEIYKNFRTSLRNGINHLKNSAEQFLVGRITTSSRFADVTIELGKNFLDIDAPRLFGTNDERRRFAEENILEISIELSQSEARRYFEEFNGVKSYLEQTRQELRMLADRIVSEKRNLVLLLDTLPGSVNSSQVTLLKASIDTMKYLLIETQERLKAAPEKYVSVHQASDNLQEAVAYSIQHTRLSGRIRILNRDIDDAIDVLNEEINQIYEWTDSADLVSKNIDDYPAEFLVEYEAIRNAFKNSLVHLERSAENYLSQDDPGFQFGIERIIQPDYTSLQRPQ